MKKERGWRWAVIFATCTLAVPMVAALMGYYGGAIPTLEQAKPGLVTGALLGVAHLLLRPVLRFVSAPLGCLTLGLFGMVIVESMACGCVPITTNHPGPMEILTNEKDGIICEEGAIEEAIIKAIEMDGHKYAFMRSHAIEKGHGYYCDLMAHRWDKIFP